MNLKVDSIKMIELNKQVRLSRTMIELQVKVLLMALMIIGNMKSVG